MKSWLKITIAIMILGLLGFYLGYRFIYNKPHQDYTRAKAELAVAASQLYNDYRSDTATANRKYLGKLIEISGRVTRIELTDTLTVAVFVFGQGMFGDIGVRCTMHHDFASAAQKIIPESDVRLKGLCNGYNGEDVILEKGSIVE